MDAFLNWTYPIQFQVWSKHIRNNYSIYSHILQIQNFFSLFLASISQLDDPLHSLVTCRLYLSFVWCWAGSMQWVYQSYVAGVNCKFKQWAERCLKCQLRWRVIQFGNVNLLQLVSFSITQSYSSLKKKIYSNVVSKKIAKGMDLPRSSNLILKYVCCILSESIKCSWWKY